MKVYFPQWQGSGTGKTIEKGAKEMLKYLNDPDIVQVPLSSLPAGKNGVKKHDINNYDAIAEQLHRFVSIIEKHQPEQIVTIGGDCGLEIVPVSYLNQKYPNLGVVWFDAHADINRPCDSPSCNFHGMPLRTLLGESETAMDTLLFSTIRASQIHYIGVRDMDDTERIRIDQDGIFAQNKTTSEELIATLRSKKITQLYLHFDFDCLEPSNYDKTYYKVPNGISIKDAENHIKILQEHFQIVGSSVLENVAESAEELEPVRGIIDLLTRKS